MTMKKGDAEIVVPWLTLYPSHGKTKHREVLYETDKSVQMSAVERADNFPGM
jgi:hypothetical protein